MVLRDVVTIIIKVNNNIKLLRKLKKSFDKNKNNFIVKNPSRYVNEKTFLALIKCMSGNYIDRNSMNLISFLIQLKISVNNNNHAHVTKIIKNNNVYKNMIYLYAVIGIISKLDTRFVSTMLLHMLDELRTSITEITLKNIPKSVRKIIGTSFRNGLKYYKKRHETETVSNTIIDIIDNIYNCTGFYSSYVMENYNTLNIVKLCVYFKYNDIAMICKYLFEKNINKSELGLWCFHFHFFLFLNCNNKTCYYIINRANLANKLDMFVPNYHVNCISKTLSCLKQNYNQKNNNCDYYKILKKLCFACLRAMIFEVLIYFPRSITGILKY